MRRQRVLCGGIFQESHSFNPIVTKRDSFEMAYGTSAVSQARSTNSVIGGIVDAAELAGFDIVLPAYFRAVPAGPVDHAVYAELRDLLLEEAKKGDIDCVVLALHGAMVTTELHDAEADLMQALRGIVGPAIPLTAGFDLHAYVTPETLAYCDFLTGYKTNPHADMAAAGQRAFAAARAIHGRQFDPVCASVHFPMLTLGNDRTDEQPLRGLQEYAADLVAHHGLYDISIFNAQQFLDVPRVGQTILAYTNGNPDLARKTADDIAKRLWDARDQLVGSYPSLQSCLEKASTNGRRRPVVVGDQGDRVAAGGPGDSTFILTALRNNFPGLTAAVPIRDDQAVDICLKHSIGDKISVAVGGRYSKVSPPVSLNGILIAAGVNTVVTFKGPANAGTQVHTGPYAVLHADNVYVILTSRPLTFLDPNFYTAFGIPAGQLQVLVARSGYHFTLNFADVGDCVTADTPGMTAYHPELMPFKLARPFYPVDKIGYQPTTTLWQRAEPGQRS